jgi:hypothetical protein
MLNITVNRGAHWWHRNASRNASPVGDKYITASTQAWAPVVSRQVSAIAEQTVLPNAQKVVSSGGRFVSSETALLFSNSVACQHVQQSDSTEPGRCLRLHESGLDHGDASS